MRALILSPGPSLASYVPQPFPGLVVGVNRAATLHGCDAWACCDLPAIESWHGAVIGSPVLIAGVEAVDNLRDRGVCWRGEVFDRRRLLDYCPHETQWVMFSATTALVYAAWRGATEIDVYGADWSGTLDWDGQAAGKNRSPDRWSLERGIWQDVLVPWLAERGVSVRRRSA